MTKVMELDTKKAVTQKILQTEEIDIAKEKQLAAEARKSISNLRNVFNMARARRADLSENK